VVELSAQDLAGKVGERLTGRRVVVAIVALAAVGLVGGYGVAMRAKPKAEKISLASPGPAGAAKPSGRLVYVHVGGAVHRPGLYEVPDGSRVFDAVRAAGGATDQADLDSLNLASKVKDGDKILVPARVEPGADPPPGGAPGAGGSAASAGGLINLNSATLEQLDSLPGVGPSTAQKIIDYRTQHGGFRSVDELMDVPGIGPAKFAELKDQVTV
jgi:competence protein ComEA